MNQVGRLVTIVVTVLRFGLDEVALSAFRQRWVRGLVRLVTVGRRLDAPRGVRLRQGLERLWLLFSVVFSGHYHGQFPFRPSYCLKAYDSV